jgi:hypothetical protein
VAVPAVRTLVRRGEHGPFLRDRATRRALRAVDPQARGAFDAFVALFEHCGPVEVIGQKTRIVIMARVRFAGATVLRDRVRLNIALTRQIEASWVERIDTYVGGRWNAHHFLVTSPEELAQIGELPSLVCEGYRDLGMQGALRVDRTQAAAGEAATDA